MGSDGLTELISLGCNNQFEMMLKIGFPRDFVITRFQKGERWDLVVFPEAMTGHIQWATWEGVFEVIKLHYSDIYHMTMPLLEELKKLSLLEINNRAGYELGSVGWKDPRYMTYENFRKKFLLEKGGSPTVVDVRAFLYNELWLTALYKGDGYTQDDHGNRGLREYLMGNMLLKDLPMAAIIPLDRVKVPDSF